jgi:hypothetical protein
VATAKDQAPAPDLWSPVFASLKTFSQYRRWTSHVGGRAAIANVCRSDTEQGVAAMTAGFAFPSMLGIASG